MNKKLKLKIIEKFGSQADFAQKVEVDESVVSRVVRGRRTLALAEQIRWAKVLCCNEKELWGLDQGAERC